MRTSSAGSAGGSTARSEKGWARMPENWFDRIGRFLGGWPDDYLVIDCETQGLDPHANTTLPVELGWCLVEDRVVVNEGGLILDWGLHPSVDTNWLSDTLQQIGSAMRHKGHTYPFDLEHLQCNGVEPKEGLREFRRLIGDALEAGYRLVGHNVYAFDRPLLLRSLASHCRCPLELPAESILDTGMVEKARMLRRFPPEPGELSVSEWYAEVRRARKVRWSLSQHCARVYGLDVKPELAHAAGYDCHTNHLLLEKMRQLAEGSCSEERQQSGNVA